MMFWYMYTFCPLRMNIFMSSNYLTFIYGERVQKLIIYFYFYLFLIFKNLYQQEKGRFHVFNGLIIILLSNYHTVLIIILFSLNPSSIF